MVPFSNGRREGTNPSSHVIELSDFRILKTIFVDQSCCFKLGISILGFKIRIPGDRSHPYRKNRWRLHINFCGHPNHSGKLLWHKPIERIGFSYKFFIPSKYDVFFFFKPMFRLQNWQNMYLMPRFLNLYHYRHLQKHS